MLSPFLVSKLSPLSCFKTVPLLFYAKCCLSEKKETNCCNSHMEAEKIARNCFLLLQATSAALGLTCLFDNFTAGIAGGRGGK